MTIFSEVLIFAAFWLFAVLSTLFYMHMFQLNSYRADDQWPVSYTHLTLPTKRIV